MKTIRRTRITIKERELVIVNNGERDENDTICPVCKTHIHLESAAAAGCVPEERPERKKLLKEKSE